MNTGWRRGAIAVLGAVVVAGCSSAPGGDRPEKVSQNDQATIVITQTADTFPVPNAGTYVLFGSTRVYISPDCVGKQIYYIGAIPTTDATKYYPPGSGTVDPYHTAWTNRGFVSGSCASGDLPCQHVADLFSIPKAHGFRYLVKELVFTGADKCIDSSTGGSVACQDGYTTGSQFFLQGLADWDSPWEYLPWSSLGQTAPYNHIDSNSHPSYGSDYRSADWNLLWNLTARDSAAPVLSKRRVCAEVMYPVTSTTGRVAWMPLDFFSAADGYDPNGHDW